MHGGGWCGGLVTVVVVVDVVVVAKVVVGVVEVVVVRGGRGGWMCLCTWLFCINAPEGKFFFNVNILSSKC